MITDVPVPLIWENDGLHCKDKSPAQVQDGSEKKNDTVSLEYLTSSRTY